MADNALNEQIANINATREDLHPDSFESRLYAYGSPADDIEDARSLLPLVPDFVAGGYLYAPSAAQEQQRQQSQQWFENWYAQPRPSQGLARDAGVGDILGPEDLMAYAARRALIQQGTQ
jgi:hypothetical protein